MASCSRDSTVRLWSLTTLITPLYINILADRSWEEIFGNTGIENSHESYFIVHNHFMSNLSLNDVNSPDSAIEQGTPPLFCGKVSRDIKQEIEKLTGNPRGKKLRCFSECLSVSVLGIKHEHFPRSQMNHHNLPLTYMPHSNLQVSLNIVYNICVGQQRKLKNNKWPK